MGEERCGDVRSTGGGGILVVVVVCWWQKWKSNVGVELRLGREVVFVLTNGRKWEHPIRGQCSNYSATKKSPNKL